MFFDLNTYWHIHHATWFIQGEKFEQALLGSLSVAFDLARPLLSDKVTSLSSLIATLHGIRVTQHGLLQVKTVHRNMDTIEVLFGKLLAASSGDIQQKLDLITSGDSFVELLLSR